MVESVAPIHILQVVAHRVHEAALHRHSAGDLGALGGTMTAGDLAGHDPHLAVHTLPEGMTTGTIARGLLPVGSTIRTPAHLAASGPHHRENGTLHQPEAVPLAHRLAQTDTMSLAPVHRGNADNAYDQCVS